MERLRLPPPKKEGRGGARAGAGRKKDKPCKKTLARMDETASLLEEARANNASPLAIMLLNLRFYHESAEGLTEKLREIALDLTPEEMLSSGIRLDKILKLLSRVSQFRQLSQQCAVDAAPYVHPRLASITWKGDPDAPIRHVHVTMTPREAALAYMEQLNQVPVANTA